MSIFMYKCPNCGMRFDVQHSMDEVLEVKCPKCDEISVRDLSCGFQKMEKLSSGKVVKEFIEETKKELAEIKKTRKFET